MKVSTKLTIGFLVTILLIWATVFLAENAYTRINEEFKSVEEDTIPSTVIMADMAEQAKMIESWVYLYIIRSNKSLEEPLQESINSLEELASEYREHVTRFGTEGAQAAEELEDKKRVLEIFIQVVKALRVYEPTTLELTRWVQKMEQYNKYVEPETISRAFMDWFLSVKENKLNQLQKG